MNYTCNATGRTPLHEAVINVRPNVVKSLIRAGAYINATDSKLNTPLHLVDRFNPEWQENLFNSTVDDFYVIAELLINNSANVFAKNYRGARPILETIDEKGKFPIYLHTLCG